MAAARSIIRQDGEGEQLWFAGSGVFTMKATAAETGGAFSLFEDDVVRGKATPLHSHPNEDETIYVLDGELLVDMDGERHGLGSTASSSPLAAFRTPSSSPPRPRVSSACKRPVLAKPSTARRASRSRRPRTPPPPARPTSSA